jgi:prevent-host-death family protein
MTDMTKAQAAKNRKKSKTEEHVRMAVSEAREDFSETINRVAYGGERIVIGRRGKDVAAVVPVADLRLLEAMEDQMDLSEAREVLANAKSEGTISWKALKAELDL